MNFTLTKLTSTLIIIALIAFGYFIYTAVGGTTINVTLNTNPDLESGLVGHWSMDGKDMFNNVADISGQGNTGYLQGQTSTTTAPGVLGQALEFDGVDDYIVSNTNSSLTANPSFTLGAWVNVPTGATTQNSYPPILWWGNSTTMEAVFFSLDDTSINKIFVGFWSGGLQMTGTFTNDEWHYFVWVRDGGGAANTGSKLYVDGVSVALENSGMGNDTDTPNVQSSPYYIQCSSGACSARHFEGLIDDVRIYNRALSAEEIKRLYELGATTRVNVTLNTTPDLENGLIGHWTFDGPDLQQNAVDRSGQGNTGYLTNFTSTTTAPGKIGQALEFDGSDDYVDVGTYTSFGTGSFSVSWWAKYPMTQNNGYAGLVSDKDWDTSASNANTWAITHNNTTVDGLRYYEVGTSGSFATNIVIDSSIPDGWHHFALYRNVDTDKLMFYRDGILVSDNNYTTDTNLVNSGLYIARAHNRQAGGLIDDVRIYNRALSAEEVKRLYDLGATTRVNVTLNTNPDLENGLVGHWTFDGNEMISNVADISGQGNTGYLEGQTSTTTAIGVIGQALEFDGSDDYVDMGDVTFLDGISSYSGCAWVDLNDDTADYMILEKQDDSQSHGFNLRFDDVGSSRNNQFRIHVDHSVAGSGNIEGAANSASASAGWQHVCFTWTRNSATGLRLYIDGVEDANSPVSTQDAGMANRSESLYIGRHSGASPIYMNGKIDDVRIYNRALSAEEISRLYDLGR